MTQATQAPSTPSMTGLEIEQCTAEEEAKSAFDVVASYVECQAVILVAEAAQRMSEQTVEKERTKRWDCLAGTAMTRKLDTSWASSLHAKSVPWTGASLQENKSGLAGNAGLTLNNWTKSSCMETCTPTDVGVSAKRVASRARTSIRKGAATMGIVARVFGNNANTLTDGGKFAIEAYETLFAEKAHATEEGSECMHAISAGLVSNGVSMEQHEHGEWVWGKDKEEEPSRRRLFGMLSCLGARLTAQTGARIMRWMRRSAPESMYSPDSRRAKHVRRRRVHDRLCCALCHVGASGRHYRHDLHAYLCWECYRVLRAALERRGTL